MNGEKVLLLLAFTLAFALPSWYGRRKVCTSGGAHINTRSYKGHTLILMYNNKHSNFTFQSLYIFIGTQDNFFFNSCEGFLRACLTRHGHLSQFWKIAKITLFYPCEIWLFLDQMTSFEVLWKCQFVILSKKYLRLCPCAIHVDKSE